VVAEIMEQQELDELIVHLVNFNVVNKPEVKNVQVDVNIPKGKRIKQVTMLTAKESGTQTQDLKFKTNKTRIQLTVPKLNGYAMLIIK
jgi:hypothetical protein